jgi:hypothetical protein
VCVLHSADEQVKALAEAGVPAGSHVLSVNGTEVYSRYFMIRTGSVTEIPLRFCSFDLRF